MRVSTVRSTEYKQLQTYNLKDRQVTGPTTRVLGPHALFFILSVFDKPRSSRSRINDSADTFPDRSVMGVAEIVT